MELTLTQNSPLQEANPSSLDELFSRDPLKLQEQDIQMIVQNLRERRKEWLAAEAAGKKKAPKTASGEKISVSSLDELGL